MCAWRRETLARRIAGATYVEGICSSGCARGGECWSRRLRGVERILEEGELLGLLRPAEDAALRRFGMTDERLAPRHLVVHPSRGAVVVVSAGTSLLACSAGTYGAHLVYPTHVIASPARFVRGPLTFELRQTLLGLLQRLFKFEHAALLRGEEGEDVCVLCGPRDRLRSRRMIALCPRRYDVRCRETDLNGQADRYAPSCGRSAMA